MGALIRFFGWATLLAPACYLLMPTYQHALASLAMTLFWAAGAPARLELELHEPFSLGLYTAMCLASTRTPRRVRFRAVALGLPALGCLALSAVLIFVMANRAFTGHASGDGGTASRFFETVMETVPWVGAPAVWIALVGPWELGSRVRHAGGRSPAGTSRSEPFGHVGTVRRNRSASRTRHLARRQ